MLAQGKGNILNAGSVGGTVTAPGLSLYCGKEEKVGDTVEVGRMEKGREDEEADGETT